MYYLLFQLYKVMFKFIFIDNTFVETFNSDYFFRH